ncbi:MAG: type secretion system protein [Gemmatimonadetes bacterium]|nr:type secretion system protein [Gemmatimonadota bacterium]
MIMTPPSRRGADVLAAAQPEWADRWLLDALDASGDPRAALALALAAPSAWEALEAAGVPRGELASAAAAACGVAVADTRGVGADAAGLLPRALAERFGVVPVRSEGGVLEVATADPRRAGVADLAFAAGRRVRLMVAAPADVQAARQRVYVEASAAPVAMPTGTVPVLNGTAQQMEERIVAEALRAGASDVHVEPTGDGMLVRLRVDGALYDALTVPAASALALVSRLKVTAGLDIADRLRPQDGRIATVSAGRRVDLRVSTLPLGERGEKVVIRILDSRSAATELPDLGFLPAEMHRFRKLLAMREGMVLVTGPTGSGKTTTLYSALRSVKSAATNVITVEDPIEYRLDGVSQVQVNEKAGLTFATALRSMLRQDPDVILVGEIRDAETAGIAVKAAMTGHLVLSTLHTNDAPSAISRLQDIGVELGALSGALKGVVTQRLLRRVCAECSQPVALSDLPMDQQMMLMGKPAGRLRRAVGCPSCRGTGYRGRMVVPEVIVVTDDLQRAIARAADVRELTDLARAGGMSTLWEAGIERVVAGLTSIHELVDNVAPPADAGLGNQADVDALLAALLGGGKPAAAPAAPSIVAAPADLRIGTGSGASRPRPSGGADGGLRVLLVDDDREARRVLRRGLEAEGFRVIEAADGEAALAYARRLRPDLVLTEVALPRLDACGLIQALSEDRDAPPVFVHTVQDDPEMLEWLAELGAADVLAGPVEPRVLAARMRGAQVAAA